MDLFKGLTSWTIYPPAHSLYFLSYLGSASLAAQSSATAPSPAAPAGTMRASILGSY